MSLDNQKALESSYVMHTFGRSQVDFVGGHGMTLVDDAGRAYTDFLAGIGVCCLGHGHPALVEAVRDQAEQLLHVSNYFYIEHRGEVAALLSKLANDDVDGARILADSIVSGKADDAVFLPESKRENAAGARSRFGKPLNHLEL